MPSLRGTATLAVAGCLTAVVLPSAAPAGADSSHPLVRAAAPARVDVRGAVTVRHKRISGPDGFDARYRARLPGRVGTDGRARASVSALHHYLRYHAPDPVTGRDDMCRAETFLGWVGGTPTGRGTLTFRVPALNLRTKSARGDVRFMAGQPYGVLGNGPCSGGTDSTFTRPLIAPEPGQQANPPSLLGAAGSDLAPGLTQRALFSPGRITLRLVRGEWRSRGSRTITSTTNRKHIVSVAWTLRSRRPSPNCVLPPARKLVGKPLAQAKRELRRYGFRRTLVTKVKEAGTQRGLVTAVAAPGSVYLCGQRVPLSVAR